MSVVDASIGTSGRLVSACVGSLVTALTVTPFDVAKVRMQAANVTRDIRAGVSAAQHLECQTFFRCDGITEHAFDKRDARFRHCFRLHGQVPGCPFAPPRGALGTLRGIFFEEGLRGLYAGLPATLMLAVPSNVLYFAAYEALRDRLRARSSLVPSFIAAEPILAGGLARMVSATICSPLEVVRTRVQAGRFAGVDRSSRRTSTVLRDLVQREGASGMFRGLSSTLWRDVPFSALYWAGVEAIRGRLLRRGWWEGSLHAPLASFIAAALAGGAAALVTTPFDVAKTWLQVRTSVGFDTGNTAIDSLAGATDSFGAEAGAHITHRNSVPRMWAVLGRVAREDGIAALMTGATPRVMRVAPACAIMLGTYEMAQIVLRPDGAAQRVCLETAS